MTKMKMKIKRYKKLKKREEVKNCWLRRMIIVILLVKNY